MLFITPMAHKINLYGLHFLTYFIPVRGGVFAIFMRSVGVNCINISVMKFTTVE